MLWMTSGTLSNDVTAASCAAERVAAVHAALLQRPVCCSDVIRLQQVIVLELRLLHHRRRFVRLVLRVEPVLLNFIHHQMVDKKEET